MKKFKYKIYFKILLVDILLVISMSTLVPMLSGYPPFSEDSSFQMQIEGLTHSEQYLLFGIFGFILHVIFIRIFFRNIFRFLDTNYQTKYASKETIKTVRKDCFQMNTKLCILQFLVLLLMLFVLFSNVKISIVLCIKFLLIYFSFMMTAMIIYTLLIRDDIDFVIRKTYDTYGELDFNAHYTKFHMNLITNLLPFFFIVIIICCLLGYSKVCEQIGESSYYYYSLYMDDIDYSSKTMEELKLALRKIPLKNRTDYFLIIPENDKESTYFSSSKGNVSDFFLLYLKNFSKQTQGKVYEYFGVEEQAYMKTLTLVDGKTVHVGFKYSITSLDTTFYFITIAILSSIAFLIVVIYWAKNISKHIVEVSNSMAKMATDKRIEQLKPLPILSNDEIGELTSSFNKIQKMTNHHIHQLKNNQDTLMERERLASLGQLIGGIAHNLKTPIMSISGASEGLHDLVKEYNASIDDPEVTSQDHHEIAQEMDTWIAKIKSHTEYMSDVITAVKGQAINFTNDEAISFTISELIKRVTILMKHELKNAIIYLNVQLKTDENLNIHGDVNSLVQVINNMISNSIQAYQGIPEQTIDMIVAIRDNSLVITIQDYASGIPTSVKNKLFKEMITTKGKNGTGLGLYMSYSTIKAHFGGNILIDSELGKGTAFHILIPLS